MEAFTQPMRVLVLVVLFVVLPVLLPVQGAAEEPDTAKLISRSRALSLAASQHPMLTVFENRKEMAVEKITQAKSGFFPQLSFSERYSRTNNPMWAFGTKLNQETIQRSDFDPDRLNDPEAIDNFAGTVSVEWSIYDAGRTWYGSALAVEGAAAADLDLERTRQQVIASAAITYDGLLLALAHRRVIDQAISLADGHVRMATDRYQSGFAVKSDTLRAQVRLMDLKQKRFEVESRVAVAGAALSAAIGEPPERRYLPSDDLTMIPCRSHALEEWVGMALANRPELGRLRKNEIIAEKEIAKQRAAHLPSVGLFGNYEINSEGMTDTVGNYTVGAMMQVPLFSGYRDVSRVREARMAINEVKALRQDLATGIEVETRQAFHEVCSARERIEVTESAMALAEENREIVADRYQNGMLTIVELLDAETALEQARTNRCQALHDFRVSYVRLLLAAGAIPGEL